ncbi:hypothetical protein DFH09DRAFT_163521 [Mycena vulgaris]|nr:hypothetical protein DFH09DRAFT_163521 [Mycena vulgaris]
MLVVVVHPAAPRIHPPSRGARARAYSPLLGSASLLGRPAPARDVNAMEGRARAQERKAVSVREWKQRAHGATFLTPARGGGMGGDEGRAGGRRAGEDRGVARARGLIATIGAVQGAVPIRSVVDGGRDVVIHVRVDERARVRDGAVHPGSEEADVKIEDEDEVEDHRAQIALVFSAAGERCGGKGGRGVVCCGVPTTALVLSAAPGAAEAAERVSMIRRPVRIRGSTRRRDLKEKGRRQQRVWRIATGGAKRRHRRRRMSRRS